MAGKHSIKENSTNYEHINKYYKIFFCDLDILFKILNKYINDKLI